jgi:TetR/AcrR family transcriptional regulator
MVKDHNTEQLIYEAARKVFMQKGLAGARMQEIADEAGINKSLLHYYFRSKDKLFEGIFNDVIMRIASGLGKTFEKDMDVMSRIREMIDLYLDALIDNRYLPLFVMNEMSQQPEKFSEIFSKNVVVHMGKFIAQISDEVKQGKINPINPFHLLLNILGLIIFPIAMLPVMTMISEKAAQNGMMPKIDMLNFLQERKKVVYDFVENALAPKNL